MDDDQKVVPRLPADSQASAEQFAEAAAIMARLRGPGGCPWDREQTLATIRKYTLEEVYEVIDAIDREHWDDLREELGDLQLQILFYAQIAADDGRFTIADVLTTLNRKLVRRHPHVFGEAAAAAAGNNATLQKPRAATSSEVLRNWDAIKRAEKAAVDQPASMPSSILEAVPRSFPALLEAAKLGSKASKVGFDWPDHRGILDKVHEEIVELEAELRPPDSSPADQSGDQSGNQRRIEEELGDVLFTVANLARHLKIDAELALRSANARFRSRFGAMEAAAPVPLEEVDRDGLEALWANAKASEKTARTTSAKSENRACESPASETRAGAV